MLFRQDVTLAVVESPPAFPAADYEGLIVGGEDLPPLLHPTMLMDLEGYAAWERHMIARCNTDARAEAVLATLGRDARQLRSWTPKAGTLADAVAALTRSGVPATPPDSLTGSLELYADVMAAVPDDLRPASDEERLEPAYRTYVAEPWDELRRPINQYLAAKAFASWTAYQGRGVMSLVRGLEAALAMVRVEAARGCRDHARRLDRELLLEAFRSADFALNHLAVGEDLAAAWSNAESE